jgi:predicted dehydrogenase
MNQARLNIGVVGAGSFAAFASKAFLKIPAVFICAVSDINEQSGAHLAEQVSAIFYPDYKDLLKDPKIDLVYIATPPFLHFEQSKMALEAGKHVICEKPAALKTTEAEELQQLAQGKGLLYVVNLMQRYNPLYKIVSTIINEKIFGEFLHGYFENYASDEYLGPEHWFWDESKSGGIFIEHGVHFFDMFSGWLGKGKVIQAIQLRRPDCQFLLADRVQATVLYRQGIVNFYHGFDQPKVLDRQEMRLQFEKGDITLYEWVPVRMRVHGLLLTSQLMSMQNLLAPHQLPIKISNAEKKKSKGRFHDIEYDELISAEQNTHPGKELRYQRMLTDMLMDQWLWIRDRSHERIIDDHNALESLKMAEYSKEIAVHL